MALTHDTRRALAERVHRKVEGRGIPRQVIDDAVARVSDALDERPSVSVSDTERDSIVAVFTAPSAPDLGSRVRSALQSESVTAVAIGISSAGRHTVAAVRVAAGARAAAERAATRIAASVSFLSDSPSAPQ
jgi:hypothetical protein